MAVERLASAPATQGGASLGTPFGAMAVTGENTQAITKSPGWAPMTPQCVVG